MRGTILPIASLLLVAATAPLRADDAPPQAEPTKEACMAAVEQARALAETLPKGNLSRYFAESHLQQALVEAGNGEFDDCLEWAGRAALEVRQPHHELKPGETLTIRHAGKLETDPAQPSQIKSED